MPKPGAEHKKLSWLAGRWDGEERLSPSPWDPEGGTETGHSDWRPALDGFYVIGDYRQEREGAVNLRGHADDTLTVGHQDAMGHHRYSWTVRGGRMEMTIENSPDGNDRSTFLEGSYRRA